MSSLPRLHVVAAAILQGEEVLACRRRPGKPEGGRWEFPGGKVESGETPTRALQRELREELDIDVHVIGQLTIDETARPHAIVVLDVYLVTLKSAHPASSTDHDALRWAPLDELHLLDWAPADLPAVRMLQARSAPSAPTASPTRYEARPEAP